MSEKILWNEIHVPNPPYENATYQEGLIALLTGEWPSREPEQQRIAEQMK